jgi:hypothetical protein
MINEGLYDIRILLPYEKCKEHLKINGAVNIIYILATDMFVTNDVCILSSRKKLKKLMRSQ